MTSYTPHPPMQRKRVTQGLWVAELGVAPKSSLEEGVAPKSLLAAKPRRLTEVRSSPALLDAGRRSTSSRSHRPSHRCPAEVKNLALSRFDALLEKHQSSRSRVPPVNAPQSPMSLKMREDASLRQLLSRPPSARAQKDLVLPDIDTTKYPRHVVEQLSAVFATSPSAGDPRSCQDPFFLALEEMILEPFDEISRSMSDEGGLIATGTTMGRARSERRSSELSKTAPSVSSISRRSSKHSKVVVEPVYVDGVKQVQEEHWEGIIDRIQSKLSGADDVLKQFEAQSSQVMGTGNKAASKWNIVRQKLLGLEEQLEKKDLSMLTSVEKRIAVVVLKMCQANKGPRLVSQEDQEDPDPIYASPSLADELKGKMARPKLGISKTISNMQELMLHLGEVKDPGKDQA